MFEQWEEILKNQPDWLEVPLPQGILDRAKGRIEHYGCTLEDAVTYMMRQVLELPESTEPRKAISTAAMLTMKDIMTQPLFEPDGQFYHVELPDYAKPAFVTWSKNYFGTLEDINAFLNSLSPDERKQQLPEHLQLTSVIIMATRTASQTDYRFEHHNIYGFPYYMHCKRIESVHVWVKYQNRFFRCIRARLDTLRYTIDEEKEPYNELGVSWGFPHIIEYVEPYAFNRLYEVEKVFKTWEEAEADIKHFPNDFDLTELFNDIFGDG